MNPSEVSTTKHTESEMSSHDFWFYLSQYTWLLVLYWS